MRHLLAALVGTVVVFMWGFGAWAAIGIWDFAFLKSTNEVAVLESMGTHLPDTGAYFVPAMPEGYGVATTDPDTLAEHAAFEERFKSGPIALVLFRKNGMAIMDPMELAKGFGIEFVASVLLACVLSATVGGFGRRLAVGFAVALFAATAVWGVFGHFFHLPLVFVAANWADSVIAWTLCSVALAAMLRERRSAA